MESVTFGVTYGWRCPVCGRIYAPGVQECFACNDEIKVKYTYNTEPIKHNKAQEWMTFDNNKY